MSFVDISGRREAEKRLIDSEQRYRTLFNSIDQGYCVIEVIFDDNDKPSDFRFLEVNNAFAAQTDLRNVVGKTMREIEPEHEDHWFEIYGEVAQSREQKHFEAPAEVLGHYYEVFAFPFGEPDANQVGVLFQDVSERKEAERERELLTQELSHRVKNTLAVVQGLAAQTSRDISSVEEFRDTFTARLQALGRAHGLLLETQWQSADLEKLVKASLEPYDNAMGKAVSFGGPPVRLLPKQGLGLSLILHELSTNAAKYGALSTPEGRLDLKWSLAKEDGEQWVSICWRETGGPPVSPPRKEGFGTKLVERSCRFELHGKAELKFDPDGFTAEIEFPVGEESA